MVNMSFLKIFPTLMGFPCHWDQVLGKDQTPGSLLRGDGEISKSVGKRHARGLML